MGRFVMCLLAGTALLGVPVTVQAADEADAVRGATSNQSLRSAFSAGLRSRLSTASHYHQSRLFEYGKTDAGEFTRQPHAFVTGLSSFETFGEIDTTDSGGGSGTVAETDATQVGVIAGWDGMLNSSLFGGIGAFYGYLETDEAGFVSRLTSAGMTAYGSYLAGGFHLDAILSYAYQDYVSLRTTLGGVATGNAGGQEISGEVQGGYDFWVDAWTMGAEVGVSYSYHEIFNLTEHGAPGLNLSYDDQQTDTLLGRLGLHASRTFNRNSANASVFHIGLGLEADLIGTENELTVENKAAMTGPLTYFYEDRDRMAATGRIGVTIPFSNWLKGDLFYDGVVSLSGVEDQSHLVSVRLTLSLD